MPFWRNFFLLPSLELVVNRECPDAVAYKMVAASTAVAIGQRGSAAAAGGAGGGRSPTPVLVDPLMGPTIIGCTPPHITPIG